MFIGLFVVGITLQKETHWIGKSNKTAWCTSCPQNLKVFRFCLRCRSAFRWWHLLLLLGRLNGYPANLRARDIPHQEYGHPGQLHLLEVHVGFRSLLLCPRELLFTPRISFYVLAALDTDSCFVFTVCSNGVPPPLGSSSSLLRAHSPPLLVRSFVSDSSGRVLPSVRLRECLSPPTRYHFQALMGLKIPRDCGIASVFFLRVLLRVEFVGHQPLFKRQGVF